MGQLYSNCICNERGGDGILGQNKECGKRGRYFPIRHRASSDCFGLSYLWHLWVDSWVNRGGDYPYSNIWVLTLKSIYAEGLQSKTIDKH